MADYNAFSVTLTLLVFIKILKIRYAQSFWWYSMSPLPSPCSLKSRDPLLITGHGRLVRATPENPLCGGLVWADGLWCICSLYISRLNCKRKGRSSMLLPCHESLLCARNVCLVVGLHSFFFQCLYHYIFFDKKNDRKTIIFLCLFLFICLREQKSFLERKYPYLYCPLRNRH